MLICHRFSSKYINVLDCGANVMVFPVEFFTSNFRVLTLKTKTKQIKRGKKGEKNKGQERERKRGRGKEDKKGGKNQQQKRNQKH